MDSVLLVVPTYNEVENIDLLVSGVTMAVKHAHLLFVDDNSQDGTRTRIKTHMEEQPEKIHLLDRPGKLGLGTAYIDGFRWALTRNYRVIVEMDADLSHNPADLPRLLAALAGCDAVIGSRYVPGGGTRNWSFIRKFVSMGGSFYARSILGLKIRDLTGGFNFWKRHVLEAIDLSSVRSEGYAFQIELKYRAILSGFRLCEEPILFVDRRAGYSKMSSRIVLEGMLRVWALRMIPLRQGAAKQNRQIK